MINQIAGPVSTSDVFYLMRVLFFIALLTMGYELSRPLTDNKKEQDFLLTDTTGLGQNTEWPGLMPWQRKASEKAIEKYAGSQEKKWQRWNEAMFERSS